MAKLNGHFYLTTAQVKRIIKGSEVKIYREKKVIVLALKRKHDLVVKLKAEIAMIKDRIKEITKKGAKRGTEDHKE